jgi:APA family basic amino acid/polyamine antiporter
MTELKRELGIFSCTMLVAGNMIGIGIFVTAGRIYGLLPDPRWIFAAWVFGGLLSLAGGLSYAELATRFPRAGGGYVYLREAYGPLMGFLAGFSSSMVTIPGTAAFLSIGFTKYAGIADPWTAKLVGLGLIWGISFINFWGVVWGAELQDLFMVLKLFLIFLLIGAGFFSGRGSFDHFAVSSAASIPYLFAFPLALVPVMYTYSGWDATVYVAGEVKNPGRTIPFSPSRFSSARSWSCSSTWPLPPSTSTRSR